MKSALASLFLFQLFLFATSPLHAGEDDSGGEPGIQLNQLTLARAPLWLKASRVKAVVERAERYLEWDIRKVRAQWHADAAEFLRLHGYGPSVLAYTTTSDHSIHLGPRVTEANFDMVFAHELTHVILFQKYKSAIPKWLEEGLANFVAKNTAPKGTAGAVFATDYKWLARQPARPIESLAHAFTSMYVPGSRSDQARYHYLASTAAIEFISSKCSVEELLQLSVGKDLRTYLSTFCGISDLNAELQAWIKRKGH